MRCLGIVVVALTLAGCEDRPQRWSESEIRDLVRDETGDAANAASVDMIVEDLANRNSDLEARISELELTARNNEAEIAALRAELDAARY